MAIPDRRIQCTVYSLFYIAAMCAFCCWLPDTACSSLTSRQAGSPLHAGWGTPPPWRGTSELSNSERIQREKECLGKWKSKRFSFCIWRIERYGDIKMAHNLALLEGIASEIKEILYGYVKVKSTSNSPVEKEAEQYFLNYFRSLPYWQAHPEYMGTCPAVHDPFTTMTWFL